MTPRAPRVCVKLYAVADAVPDSAFVPIFHRWIRDRVLDFVFIDVADYAHVPEGPGVMLVTDEMTFALDRADGRFGLLGQQRRPSEGNAAEAIAIPLRRTFAVADALEREPSLAGRLAFDRATFRVEINDRLAAPNHAGTFGEFGPAIVEAAGRVFPGERHSVVRVLGDHRARPAIDVVRVANGDQRASTLMLHTSTSDRATSV